MKHIETFGATGNGRLRAGVALSGLALSLALAGVANAQDLGSGDEGDYSVREDIIVTGTLVRGIEQPTGTNVVGVSEADIESSSATTATELLTDVPQFGAFNDLQTLSGGGNFVTTNRPNLRSLPGFTTTGTSATLMLVDGNRVVGMGISSTTPDADFIPPGILERVEIVPDGGSALYGSDAVAGVVNFITKKRFNGVDARARYGFGKNYHTIDADLTVGKDWGSGSLWVSYNLSKNDAILGRDRSYNFTPEAQLAGVTILDSECSSPNILVGGFDFPQFGLFAPAPVLHSAQSRAAANSGNICDLSDEAGMYPKQERHSVYAGLYQELNDWLEVDVRAFYYRKESHFTLGQFSATSTIDVNGAFGGAFPTSPFAIPLSNWMEPAPGFIIPYPLETQNVGFALGPNYSNDQSVTLDVWGFRPTFTADLGGGWQARTTVGYSESKSLSHTNRLSQAALAAAITAGTFNPYDPVSADPSVVATLLDFETYGLAKQSQVDAKVIVDGDLFDLPGGAVKLAVGAEYIKETYDSRKGDTVPANFLNLPFYQQSRNVKSVFGELVAPILKTDAGMSLTVSASGRYDDYSDVGDTFNPKFGATFKPVDWVSIRGSWGKSFVAPSLSDSAVADPTNLNWITGGTLGFIAPPAVLAANGFPPTGAGQYIMFLLGSNPGLQPQKAETWSIGADIEPTFVPGLRLSATYYNLTYTGIIQLVPFINQNLFFSTFADQAFTLNPTQAEIDAVVAQAGIVTGAPCGPQPACVYGIQDVRKQNLGGFKQDGIDFAIDYRTNTGFGSLDFSIAGTYVLNRKNQPTAGLPYTADVEFSDFKLRTNVGANIGNLRAQATWNYNKGYNLAIPVGLNNQMKIGDFNTVDLFFKYDFDGEGAMQNLALTLTVNNVFDQGPPVYTGGDIVRNQRGFRNGNTLGRLVQVGISKKF